MAFMNNMRDRLTQAGQSTVQKAKDLSELAKLNGIILSSEKKISELYEEIGYEVYCAYYETPLPEVSELIKQVTDLHQTINDCKMQIKTINTVETCPQCGAKICKDMVFCSGCGYKLTVAEQSDMECPLFCSNCGASIPADSIFCASCGHKIG